MFTYVILSDTLVYKILGHLLYFCGPLLILLLTCLDLFFSGKIQNSSVMISESDFSSEEETIFMNPKKSNGYVPKNGLSKPHLKTKLKT